MKPRAGRCIGIEERAIGPEGGDSIFIARKQAPQPFAERERGSRRFDGNDEDGGAAVIENDARAEAGERAAEARAETAQPLQPFL